MALIHSEGILAGEMKHGPLALVDENLPIIVIATQDRMYSKMQSVILQLLARKARLIILCNAGDAAITKICQAHSGCRVIEVSQVKLLSSAIKAVLVFVSLLSTQVLIYQGSKFSCHARGLIWMSDSLKLQLLQF